MSERPAVLPPALCITVHDVAPATWPLCQILMQTVFNVAPVPLTHLVVPHYHRLPVADDLKYRRQLDACLRRGDELALHGYVHIDEAPRATGWRERYLREIFTRREGEFAALAREEASRRIALGLDWFQRRGWPVQGFVAPAWLLGAESWCALRQFPFSYTSTAYRLYLLRTRQVLASPTLVYFARNRAGRFLSQRWNDRLERRLEQAPLIRLALHPADARHPALMRHLQALLERLLPLRAAMTKSAFVARWRSQTIGS
jgi:predicted deacetylase